MPKGRPHHLQARRPVLICCHVKALRGGACCARMAKSGAGTASYEAWTLHCAGGWRSCSLMWGTRRTQRCWHRMCCSQQPFRGRDGNGAWPGRPREGTRQPRGLWARHCASVKTGRHQSVSSADAQSTSLTSNRHNICNLAHEPSEKPRAMSNDGPGHVRPRSCSIFTPFTPQGAASTGLLRDHNGTCIQTPPCCQHLAVQASPAPASSPCTCSPHACWFN